jgi:hypothetical protein
LKRRTNNVPAVTPELVQSLWSSSTTQRAFIAHVIGRSSVSFYRYK